MCGNMKFISSVDQDISRVSKANECKICCSTREIISYFQNPNIYVLFCLLYKKKIVVLPHKNRAVYSDAFHDNQHM